MDPVTFPARSATFQLLLVRISSTSIHSMRPALSSSAILKRPGGVINFKMFGKGQKRQSNLAKKLDFDSNKSWVSMVLKCPIPHSSLCGHSCPWPQFLGSARRLLQSTRRIRKYMTTSRSGSISAVGIHGNLTTYLSKKDVKLSITKHDSDLHRKVPALVGTIARYLSQAAVFTSPSL